MDPKGLLNPSSCSGVVAQNFNHNEGTYPFVFFLHYSYYSLWQTPKFGCNNCLCVGWIVVGRGRHHKRATFLEKLVPDGLDCSFENWWSCIAIFLFSIFCATRIILGSLMGFIYLNFVNALSKIDFDKSLREADNTLNWGWYSCIVVVCWRENNWSWRAPSCVGWNRLLIVSEILPNCGKVVYFPHNSSKIKLHLPCWLDLFCWGEIVEFEWHFARSSQPQVHTFKHSQVNSSCGDEFMDVFNGGNSSNIWAPCSLSFVLIEVVGNLISIL